MMKVQKSNARVSTKTARNAVSRLTSCTVTFDVIQAWGLSPLCEQDYNTGEIVHFWLQYAISRCSEDMNFVVCLFREPETIDHTIRESQLFSEFHLIVIEICCFVLQYCHMACVQYVEYVAYVEYVTNSSTLNVSRWINCIAMCNLLFRRDSRSSRLTFMDLTALSGSLP